MVNSTGFKLAHHRRTRAVAAREPADPQPLPTAAFDRREGLSGPRSSVSDAAHAAGAAAPSPSARVDIGRSVADGAARRGSADGDDDGATSTTSPRAGEPAAVLIAAEAADLRPAFGYGAATERVGYALDTNRARLAPQARGRRRSQPRRQTRPSADSDHRSTSGTDPRTPGAIGRSDLWWDRFTGARRFPKDEDPDKRFPRRVWRRRAGLSYVVDEKWDEQSGTPNAKAQIHEPRRSDNPEGVRGGFGGTPPRTRLGPDGHDRRPADE